MIITLLILIGLIATWFIAGAIIVFHHYKREYSYCYSFWEGVVLSILWSWFGCLIIVFDALEKYKFWKNK